ncbi:MAG: 50S ribosomal protein L33 [bacterium]|nr:50S ribosomal protein L33 [bacterium]
MVKRGSNETIGLRCDTCKNENYVTTKNRKKYQKKMELKKYCPKGRTHTLHKEHKV